MHGHYLGLSESQKVLGRGPFSVSEDNTWLPGQHVRSNTWGCSLGCL